MTRYRISELADRTGTPPSTLRFYDKAGLLPAARSQTGYRLYGEEAVERLRFIASGKDLGLPLAEIRALLASWDRGPCADVRRRLRPLLAARLAQAGQRAVALALFTARLRQALAEMDGPSRPGRCAPGCGCLPGPAGQAGRPAAVPEPRSSTSQDTPGPVACSLTVPEQADRAEQWRQLLALATSREPADGGLRVRLPVRAAGLAAELAAAEQRCCPFFGFTLHLTGCSVVLEVRAPAAAAPLLTGVFGAAA